MKNNKGQALIEFILILPIILLFLTSIFDIGNIIINKYQLQDNLDSIVELYQNDDTTKMNLIADKENFDIKISSNDSYTKLKLTKNLKITTPGLSNLIGSKITTERNIYISTKTGEDNA